MKAQPGGRAPGEPGAPHLPPPARRAGHACGRRQRPKLVSFLFHAPSTPMCSSVCVCACPLPSVKWRQCERNPSRVAPSPPVHGKTNTAILLFVDLVQGAPSITKPFPCRQQAKTYLLIILQKKMRVSGWLQSSSISSVDRQIERREPSQLPLRKYAMLPCGALTFPVL